MEGLIYDIPCELGETYHLTLYSDLHDDARECAHDQLKKHMDRRASYPRAMFFGLGDISNFVIPGPDKRAQPSTPVPELAVSDEYIDDQIERQFEMYKGYPWVAIGIGNHCTSVINHHFTNPVKRLIERLNRADRGKLPSVQYAGYSGFARFRFATATGAGARCTFNLIYHHGAWGGAVIKGKGGAQRWADRNAAGQIWNVAAYGHNHACQVDMIPNCGMSDRGKIFSVDQYVVNTGTFLRSQTQGGSPAYSEIRGYPPVSLAAPLIKVTPTSDRVMVSVETGDC